ncbi:hypothetical protein [Nitrosomonas communis]|uniref:hypothetical protein n=1 Tax=Nitrosomonas communis TaxID=44574 RepID=UPI003D29A6B3
MANNIEELRGILFEAIRGVKDGTLDLEKAKVIEGLSQTIINSAKVEVDYLRVTEGVGGTSFMIEGKDKEQAPNSYLHLAGTGKKQAIR